MGRLQNDIILSSARQERTSQLIKGRLDQLGLLNRALMRLEPFSQQ
jgi:hypothetical protein